MIPGVLFFMKERPMTPVRMKKRKQFVHVASHGIKVVAGGMIVQACPNESDVVRTGFTVTKKVGCAVIRNRTRRRLRELVRVCPMVSEMAGLDLVFIGRLSTKDRPYPKLYADLLFALKEIRQHYRPEEA